MPFNIDLYLDKVATMPNTIFKNRDVMRSTFIPENLPHRNEQIKRITQIIAPALSSNNRSISNLFLYGKTGTGKTAVILYVLKHFMAKCRELGKEERINTTFINCRDVDTSYRVLARLSEAVGEDIPYTGLPTDVVYERFKSKLEEVDNRLLIIVLDEIDQLVKKSHGKKTPNKALYELTRINSSLKNARVHLIGISNDLNFKSYLDSRVLSSLSEEEMVFPPYNSLELEDILKERAEMGLNDGVIGEGTISLAAGLAAREHGDARRAIDLLRVAAELAERNGEFKITHNHIRDAIKNIEHDKIKDTVDTLPLQSKLILWSIYLLEDKNLDDNTTGDVYSAYVEVCTALASFEPLTQRRVGDLINELDMLGLINAKIVSLGRYGRTKKIRLNIPKNIIEKMIEEDSTLSSLKNFKLKYEKDERKYDIL
ncbi:MAG: Cdc6/Cdc18 family protein [Candidatus Helarchaeota archaeon]